MSEDKKKVVGIMIPEECGKADKYELTAIMYFSEGIEEAVKEYSVFITEEDYEENKIFTSILSNMNPTLLLFPDEVNAGMGSLEYDLVEAGLIHTENDVNAIVVSEIVNASDTVWNSSEVEREVYLAIKAKVYFIAETKGTMESLELDKLSKEDGISLDLTGKFQYHRGQIQYFTIPGRLVANDYSVSKIWTKAVIVCKMSF